MFTSTSTTDSSLEDPECSVTPAEAVATLGFAIAPCTLGFVMIGLSSHCIRSIRVGDDPEMLMSDLQNEFPSAAIALRDEDDADIVYQVAELVECINQTLYIPIRTIGEAASRMGLK